MKVENKQGYVYILGVKDISLAISKIGMTQRTPIIRCVEINKNSTTGDLLWEVVDSVFVNNCYQAEYLLHTKLAELRQKGREFFNITPDDAKSILFNFVKESELINEVKPQNKISKLQSKNIEKSIQRACSAQHEKLEEIGLYKLFRDRLGLEGRYFGQSGKGIVGISDDNKGVQWNLAVYEDTGDIRLGVNLEGMKYLNFPIAHFINKELKNPSINRLKESEFDVTLITIGFYRDAWQLASRPKILESNLKNSGYKLSELNNDLWTSTLKEAKKCLIESDNGHKRGKQWVTKIKKDGSQHEKEMDVSPHLTIQSYAGNINDTIFNIEDELKEAFVRLNDVYAWVSNKVN